MDKKASLFALLLAAISNEEMGVRRKWTVGGDG